MYAVEVTALTGKVRDDYIPAKTFEGARRAANTIHQNLVKFGYRITSKNDGPSWKQVTYSNGKGNSLSVAIKER